MSLKKVIAVLLVLVVSFTTVFVISDEEKAEARPLTKLERICKWAKYEGRASIPRLSYTTYGKIRIYMPYQKAKYNAYYGYYLLKSTKRNGRYTRVTSYKNSSRVKYDYNVSLGGQYWYKIQPYWYAGGRKIKGKSSRPVYVTSRFKHKKKMTVKAYAYTGHTMTASGMSARRGRIAVDPRVIPLGSYVWVQGYGFATAADTGGNIKGKTVDLFMDSESQCYNWGVRYKTLYILKY